MKAKRETCKELGRFFLDLAKLTYAGLVLVAFGAWALEKKIDMLEFVFTVIIAGIVGVLFVWWGTKLLKEGYKNKTEEGDLK